MVNGDLRSSVPTPDKVRSASALTLDAAALL
jgi:hypothetical protein